MAELAALMKAQRACRRFDPEGKVLDSDVEQMLQLAVHAPSAENTQPWSFVVVRDDETRKSLTDWWTETWNAGGGDFVKQSVDDPVLVSDLEYGFVRGGFAAAPVVIVVCADTERVAEVYAASSIYPAVQNLLLAAADLPNHRVDHLRRRPRSGATGVARHRAADGGGVRRSPPQEARATASAAGPCGHLPREVRRPLVITRIRDIRTGKAVACPWR
jgi:hypothetical protein